MVSLEWIVSTSCKPCWIRDQILYPILSALLNGWQTILCIIYKEYDRGGAIFLGETAGLVKDSGVQGRLGNGSLGAHCQAQNGTGWIPKWQYNPQTHPPPPPQT